MRVIARMNIGGPAYHVSLLSGRLGPRGYDTILLTGSLGVGEGSFDDLADHYRARRQVVPGLRPSLSPLADLRALVHLQLAMRRFRPDIVHTHTAKAGTLGRLAALVARGHRPIIVHTYHGHVLSGYFGRRATSIFRGIERVLGRYTDCLIGVSDATIDELVAMRIAPRGKFRRIPIGLDLDKFLRLTRGERGGVRDELGVADADVLAVFVGRLAPIKRVDVLLRALASARAQGAPVRLAIVGDGELRVSLERQARELGLHAAVHFLGFQTDLTAILAGADIAVLASDNEGTPVALIEAAAAGVPSIATHVGGVPEIVQPQTGLLVPPDDQEAFADALVRLATAGEATRRAMGLAARRHVRGRFDGRRLVEDIDRLYSELLAGRTP